MKYGYAVKRNGVLYKAGEEVPDIKVSVVEDIADEKQKAPGNPIQYKKSDILQMRVEDLKILAKELGIDGAEEATGTKLKEDIIAKLGL